MTDADRQRAFRERRNAKLQRLELLEATLCVIRDELANSTTTLGVRLRKLAEDALA